MREIAHSAGLHFGDSLAPFVDESGLARERAFVRGERLECARQPARTAASLFEVGEIAIYLAFGRTQLALSISDDATDIIHGRESPSDTWWRIWDAFLVEGRATFERARRRDPPVLVAVRSKRTQDRNVGRLACSWWSEHVPGFVPLGAAGEENESARPQAPGAMVDDAFVEAHATSEPTLSDARRPLDEGDNGASSGVEQARRFRRFHLRSQRNEAYPIVAMVANRGPRRRHAAWRPLARDVST